MIYFVQLLSAYFSNKTQAICAGIDAYIVPSHPLIVKRKTAGLAVVFLVFCVLFIVPLHLLNRILLRAFFELAEEGFFDVDVEIVGHGEDPKEDIGEFVGEGFIKTQLLCWDLGVF